MDGTSAHDHEMIARVLHESRARLGEGFRFEPGQVVDYLAMEFAYEMARAPEFDRRGFLLAAGVRVS